MRPDEPRTISIGNSPAHLDSEKQTSYVKEFERRFKFAESTFSEWRYWSKKYFDTYAGDPWPEGVIDILDEEGRPHTNFNYAISTANTVLGQDMADRKEPRYKANAEGGDFADEWNAENLTKVARQVYHVSKAHRQESMAHLDQLITGYGWTETWVNTHRFPHRIEVRYVDCFEVYVDPNYQQDNCADARYIIREKRWSLEKAIARWPQHEDDLRNLTRSLDSANKPITPRVTPDAVRSRRAERVEPFNDDEYVWIYDYQRKRFEKYVAYRDPKTKKYTRVPEADYKKVEEALLAEIDPTTGVPLHKSIENISYTQEIVDRGFLAGVGGQNCLVLEEPKLVKEGMFTLQCATGYRRKERTIGRTQHFGLLAVAYEPQLLAAKALSSGIEYIARGTKGGLLYDPQAIEDPASFATESVKPGARIQTTPGWLTEGKKVIEKLPEPVWNPGYDTIFRTAVQAGGQTTNVTDSLKGTLQSERSNVLISNLQQQSIISLNPILDPLAQFRVNNATLIALMIQNYMSADQYNRILKTSKLEGVTYTLERDPMTGEEIEKPILIPEMDAAGNPVLDQNGQPFQRPVTPYDLLQEIDVQETVISVDLGAASTTAKQALWRMMNDHAAFNDMMKDPDLKDLIVPWMIENIPDFPADDAKTMAAKLRDRFRLREMQGTFEGILATLETLPPEQIEQLDQVLEQIRMASVEQLPPGEDQMPTQ